MSDRTKYNVTRNVNQDDKLGGRTPGQPGEKRPCLIMIKGDFVGQVYDLSRDVTMIGRSDEVQLVISDISVSRRHAMIVNRQGVFHLSDLDSTNGTLLNREPIASATPLKEGDKITVGDVGFKFSYQDEEDTTYHEVLRNMAIEDGLTGIFNRRYFIDAVAKEFEYTRRNQSGLAIILFDIDDFKAVNDAHGHAAGDFVLKYIAELLLREARGYDVFARYGGEEFAFVMRGASRDAAQALAERVRNTVKDAALNYEGESLSVTISLGVSYWEGKENLTSSDVLIQLADQQMYEAKRAGKDCVRVTPA